MHYDGLDLSTSKLLSLGFWVIALVATPSGVILYTHGHHFARVGAVKPRLEVDLFVRERAGLERWLVAAQFCQRRSDSAQPTLPNVHCLSSTPDRGGVRRTASFKVLTFE
jgi:hypothetical protein